MTSKDPSSQHPLINFIRENSSFSRREIVTHLNSGTIKVNGMTVQDGSHLVSTRDAIVMNKVKIHKKKRLYFKFNKPVNVISTFDDPNGRKDLSFFLKKHRLPTTLRPCGRLDRDSSGLLLFSNDGHFINRNIHPSFSIKKTYDIILDQPLNDAHQQHLSQGLFLSDGPVTVLFESKLSPTHYIVSISIGRNRVLRRSFEFFGYTIQLLHRKSIGHIHLATLTSGHFEELPFSIIKNLVRN